MNLKTVMLSYTGINVLNASVPFFLLPILTLYLKPDDYGTLSLVQLLMAISLPIVLMGTQGLLTIEYSRLSQQKFQTMVSTMLWIPLFGFALLEILFYIFEAYLIQYFHIPEKYLFYLPLFVLAQVIPTIVPIIFQAKQNVLDFGIYKISLTILNVLLSLFLIIIFSLGWEGRLIGIVTAYAVLSIAGSIILFKLELLSLRFEWASLKSTLKFGIPLIPHSIAGVFLAMSDRIFLANMLDTESVGIYSVAFQIASALTIVMSSINQAWAPHLFKRLNDGPDIKEKIKIIKEIYTIMLVMTLFTAVFILLIPMIYDLFIATSYHEGVYLSIYICIALLFQGFYFMVTNFIFYTKKTYILTYITSFSVFTVFLLNYFLIKSFGMYGSAYAMILSWVLFFVITFVVANRVYKMPWRLV